MATKTMFACSKLMMNNLLFSWPPGWCNVTFNQTTSMPSFQAIDSLKVEK